MSERADAARIDFLLKLITDTENIALRHGGIEPALKDFEGHYALMMCCQQIGEILNKIENSAVAAKLPVQLAYRMRNIIAHDYLGIDIKQIALTIQNDLPELKIILNSLLQR